MRSGDVIGRLGVGGLAGGEALCVEVVGAGVGRGEVTAVE
jgi:hypothetical protein